MILEVKYGLFIVIVLINLQISKLCFSKLKIPHNYYSFGLFSSWIASFLAIFVEREHRRSLLATYVSNVVS